MAKDILHEINNADFDNLFHWLNLHGYPSLIESSQNVSELLGISLDIQDPNYRDKLKTFNSFKYLSSVVSLVQSVADYKELQQQ